MNELRSRRGVAGRLAVALCLLAIGTTATAQPPVRHKTFAMLPPIAGDTGLPYAIYPSAIERNSLGARLQTLIRQRGRVVAIDQALVKHVLATDGFNQDSRLMACDDAVCARRVGRQLGVDIVIYGTVTREMALIWSTEVFLVDVRTGVERGPYQAGYKGDYLSLMHGLPELAQTVSERLVEDAPPARRAGAKPRKPT